jgi:drug/metabolite transporter (DMT)-like permease
MKQQAGIGIILALTTAMCWGALPIAMKQVLEVMEPTVVFYRFLMASIGLGAILAIKGKLPPMRIFRKPRWLVLLAIATGGLFGNFILFSSSLQYLSPTASQVIGQLSPVGMMVASVDSERAHARYPGGGRVDVAQRAGDVLQYQSD